MYNQINIDNKLRDRKNRDYSVVMLENWSQIEEIFNQNLSQWVFRGQQNWKWNMESFLSRKCKNWSDVSAEDILDIFWQESKSFDIVKSINPQTKFDRLCIMQQYGVPTRLLDWTKDPYIAAFFAFYELIFPSVKYCAIWAINRKWCKDRALKLIKSILSDQNIDDTTILTSDDYFDKLFKEDHLQGFVLPIEPPSFARINKQQGIFLFPSQSGLSFKDNLVGEYDQNGGDESNEERKERITCRKQMSDFLIQFKLLHKLKQEVDNDLKKRGITIAKLFQSSLDFYGNFVSSQFERFDKISGDQQKAQIQKLDKS